MGLAPWGVHHVVAVNLADDPATLDGVTGRILADTARGREGEPVVGTLALAGWEGAVLALDATWAPGAGPGRPPRREATGVPLEPGTLRGRGDDADPLISPDEGRRVHIARQSPGFRRAPDRHRCRRRFGGTDPGWHPGARSPSTAGRH